MKSRRAKPFVKWAGGKGRVLPVLESRLPKDLSRHEFTYIEPFVGGGALLFHLLNRYPNISRAVICDRNTALINAYRIVKDHPLALIGHLKELQDDYLPRNTEARKEFYLHQREAYNRGSLGPVETAALFIFLNRTCFNGLYRVNGSGKFNVPMGNYRTPLICDSDTILADSEVLRRVEILDGDFSCIRSEIRGRTFVYFDPPYRPVGPTSKFNNYTAEVFDDREQLRLRDFVVSISGHCQFLLSNSDCPDNFFDSLYSGFDIERVQVSRPINSDIAGRGKVSEIIVSPASGYDRVRHTVSYTLKFPELERWFVSPDIF